MGGSEEEAGFFDGLAGDVFPEEGVDFDLGGIVVDKRLKALALLNFIGLVVSNHPAVCFPF